MKNIKKTNNWNHIATKNCIFTITTKDKTLKKLILYFSFFLISLTVTGQNKSSFICGYNTAIKPNFCDFVNDKKYINDLGVLNNIKSIVDLVGLPQNFILVECSNVNNAFAFCSQTGTRYIVIDSKWMTSIGSKNWFIIGVLAHEIGHHLCGHTILNKELTNIESQNQELEADKFSGLILQGLGATLEQALSALNTLVPNELGDKYTTHPSRSKRLIAIKAGYNKSSPKYPSFTPSTSAEEYFNLGLETAKDPDVNSSENDLLKALNYYLEAIKINPSFIDALQNAGGINILLGDRNMIPQPFWEDAMKFYNKLIEIDQYNVPALNNIGQIYSTKGYRLTNAESYYTAIKYFNACIKIDPTFAGAYLNRGIAYGNLGFAFHLPTLSNACSDYDIACRLGATKACDHYKNACR